MLEEELSKAVVASFAPGRLKPGGDEAKPSVIGVRHGHRDPDADGHVWRDADRRAARSVDRRGRRERANGGAVRCAPTSAAPGPPTP